MGPWFWQPLKAHGKEGPLKSEMSLYAPQCYGCAGRPGDRRIGTCVMKRACLQVAYGGRGERVNDYRAGLPVDHQEGDILINAFPSRVGVVANLLLASPVAVCCVSFLLEMHCHR